MKVLYANNLYAPYFFGGTERTLLSLVEGISARGHDTAVLTTGPGSGVHEEFFNGIRILRVGIRNLYWPSVETHHPAWKRTIWHLVDMYNPFMKQLIIDIIHNERPDIISLHNLSGFSVSAWSAAKQERVHTIQVLHDQYLLCPRCTMFNNDTLCKRQCLSCRCMRFYHPQLSNKVSAVVGVSEFILNHHLQYGYFSETSIKKVIHNARNNSTALAVPRRTPDGTTRFGFIGLLNQIKGIELLLKVFTEIAKEDWQLHIAGSGEASYDTFLRNSYKRDNIIFRGFQKPEEFYPSIDVLVVPSTCNDNFPGVVIEGLSFGTPIIGAKRGGIPEMVVDKVNGLLFEPDNPEELRKIMIKMAENDDFITSASRAARDTAPYFLDMNRFLSAHEELYKKLCKIKIQ